MNENCHFLSIEGKRCKENAEYGGYCFWHDKTTIKSEPDLVQRLEAYAKTGKSLQGFCLRHANLSGINLVKAGHREGYDLRDVDLYRANVSQAHLFAVQLQGASLMKADFSGSNLHRADLSACNLLGIKLNDCKLEYINWGAALLQEEQARHQNDVAIKQDLLQQSEEVYRKLRLETERQGLPDIAGLFFQREMKIRRLQKPLFSVNRMMSKAVDMLCGYGEKPLRVIVFSMVSIAISAVAYFILGLSHGDQQIAFNLRQGFEANLYDLMECLYFSVITFTTLGYGDIVPTDTARFVAAIEAFSGSFTLALFVVVFVKKMTR